MKKIKFIVPALAIVIIIGVLAAVFIGKSGEGNSPKNNGALTGTVTLAEYLNSGPKVGFSGYGQLDKDGRPPEIFLFEDGKVYRVCTQRDDGRIWSPNNYDGGLTWGDISKMTDDELLEFAQAHKETEWYESGSWYVRYPTGEYILHVYTDSTGNYREYEKIEIEEQFNEGGWSESSLRSLISENLYLERTEVAEIYDSVFSGVCNESYTGLWFRTGSDLRITLDNPGDEGVEVD